MYLMYRSGSKRRGALDSLIFEPVYDWYTVTEPTAITSNFSLGKCERNVYVLYHTKTLQAVCIGFKQAMRKLAKEMESFTFDGVDTWTKERGTIRSLTTLKESKESGKASQGKTSQGKGKGKTSHCKASNERNVKLLLDKQAGMTSTELSNKYGISRQRVNQIVREGEGKGKE